MGLCRSLSVILITFNTRISIVMLISGTMKLVEELID